MRSLFLLGASLFLFSCRSPWLVEDKLMASNIYASLETEKDTFELGEYIYPSFDIINGTEETVYIHDSPHALYYNGTRIIGAGGFDSVLVYDNAGKIVPLLPSGMMISGRFGITDVPVDDTLSIPVFLHHYATIQQTGLYKIVAYKELIVYFDKKQRWNYRLFYEYKSKRYFKAYKKYIQINLKAEKSIYIIK